MRTQTRCLSVGAVLGVLTSACTVQLVAPYNSALQQKASSMESEVSSWELAMRNGAGTLVDDPRYPDVAATINKWRGEADAMLTLAVSGDPGSVSCNEVAQATFDAIKGAMPSTVPTQAPEPASGGCEVGLVADVTSGIDDLVKALNYCRMSWVPDSYFSRMSLNRAAASTPPAAPSQDDQNTLNKSCLAEFKLPQQAAGKPMGIQHGRAVSHLLSTVKVIVYVENRKKSAASK